MHACGHDGHVALGVELARLLGGLRDELSRHLSGRIRLIFQPAEEEGEGAPGMVAAGAVDGVRALFGLHLSMQASRSGDRSAVRTSSWPPPISKSSSPARAPMPGWPRTRGATPCWPPVRP